MGGQACGEAAVGKLGIAAAALAVGVACAKGTADEIGKGPVDSGPVGDIDAGTQDAGGTEDAGSTDAGADAGTDGGTKASFGGPGPWPIANITYGAREGIQETPVVGFTTDESQNIWVATNAALYLMRPGQKSFQRFDATGGRNDGNGDVALHLQSNPVEYCADRFFDGGDKSCRFGAAADPGISEIVGGGPNEVFVGYYGFHDYSHPETDGEWFDPYRHTGKLDRVRIKADASGRPVLDARGNVRIDVVRFDLAAGNSVQFWHDRTVYKMVYDHFTHPHELYVGTEHGVDKISPDLWFPPNPSWPFLDYLHWMSDHLHPVACLHQLCISDDKSNESRNVQMMGEWRGLALSAKGDLWVGGKWSAGKIFYTAPNTELKPDGTPKSDGTTGWFQRGGKAFEDPKTGFSYSFGNIFCGTNGTRDEWNGSTFVHSTCSPMSGTPPVFWPPAPGDPVSISAVTEAPDGTTWWASSPNGPFPAYGIASYDGHRFKYFDPMRDAGLGESSVSDLLALPDGRIVVAGPNSGVVFWDPVKGTRVSLRGGSGLPDDHVQRLELDRMVDPPALHISTWGGAVVLRKLP